MVDRAGRLSAAAEAPGSCCGVSTAPAQQSWCESTRPSAEVARERRYVAGQWTRPGRPETGGDGLEAFDAFLASRERALGLSGMAFQDAWTLDLDRLRQCHIHVVAPDRRVIPFCAYNLTSRDGRPLYRAAAHACEPVE